MPNSLQRLIRIHLSLNYCRRRQRILQGVMLDVKMVTISYTFDLCGIFQQ
jgi:hypothetical protein